MRRMISRKSIFGLESILSEKVSYSDILQTKESVLSATEVNKVAAAVAIKDIYDELNTKIINAKNAVSEIIDDTSASGTNKTWSIDKIKSFVTSVDDTVVVENIQERDSLNAYDSLVAFVIDTSDDEELEPSLRGKPFTYIYSNGKWYPISPVGEVDTEVFVKKSELTEEVLNQDGLVPTSKATYNAIENAKTDLIEKYDVRIVSEVLTISDDKKLELSATPIGNLVGEAAEINTDEGVIIVDATVSGKTVTLADDDNIIPGLKARVTYLTRNSEYLAAHSNENSDNDQENQENQEDTDN